MKKRTLTGLLAAFMSFAAVAGCSGGGGTEGTSASVAATEATVTEAATTAEAAVTEAASEDIAQQADFSLPYTGEPVTLSIMGWESFSPVNPESRFGQWFQERIGNITMEFEVPAEGTDTKIQMYLATGDMPDIMIHRDVAGFMRDYGDGSRTVNLLDYAQYMPEYTARRETFSHLSLYDRDGATYVFNPCWYDLPSEVWSQNQTMMDKYNLSEPTNYAEMKAAMDTVLAGETDMIGMLFNIWGFGYQFQCFAHLFGSMTGPTSIYYDYNKEQWVYALTGDADIMRTTTVEMAEAYAKGYIHPDFASMTEEQLLNIRNNGKSLFYDLYLEGFGSQGITDLTTFENRFINTPAAEGVKPFIRTDYASDNHGWGFVVSKESEHPELACLILELIGSQEMDETWAWGWEGETYTEVDGARQFTEEFQALSNDERKTTWGITAAEPYIFRPHMSQYYSSDAMLALWTDEGRRALEMYAGGLTSGEILTYHGRVTPMQFTPETLQDISAELTPINTFVTETLMAFVLGNKSLDEWDSFIAEIPSYGDLDWILEQYNTAEQSPDRANQFERTWVMP